MKNRVLFLSLLMNAILISFFLFTYFKYEDKILNMLPIHSNSTVVMFGDSHTAGGNWGQLLGRNDIQNSGVGGFTTSHFVWILHDKVLKYNPEICFIEGGGNDLSVGIPYTRIVNNITNIIDTLQKHKIKPVLQSVIYSTDRNQNLRADSLNSMYQKIAKNKNIQYLDLNIKLTKDGVLKNEFTIDGVHLKQHVYPIWASVVKQYLDLHEI